MVGTDLVSRLVAMVSSDCQVNRFSKCALLAVRKHMMKAMASGISAPMLVRFRLRVSFHIVKIVVAQGL